MQFIGDTILSRSVHDCLFIRRHPLLHVSMQYLRPMRDAWFFFTYHLAATADHSDAIPSSLSQLTGSFAILPLPRRSETIQAIVPIPDALVSRNLCDRKSVKRSFFPLSRDEISRAEGRACTIVRLTCGQFYIFAALVPKRLSMFYTNWVKFIRIRSKFIIDSFCIKSYKLFKKYTFFQNTFHI